MWFNELSLSVNAHSHIHLPHIVCIALHHSFSVKFKWNGEHAKKVNKISVCAQRCVCERARSNKMCESERKLSVLSIARCLSVQNGKFSTKFNFGYIDSSFRFKREEKQAKQQTNKQSNDSIPFHFIYIRFVWINENCCNYNC